MFIAPRDVSDKMDGGEGSHVTSDTQYSGTERFQPHGRKFEYMVHDTMIIHGCMD